MAEYLNNQLATKPCFGILMADGLIHSTNSRLESLMKLYFPATKPTESERELGEMNDPCIQIPDPIIQLSPIPAHDFIVNCFNIDELSVERVINRPNSINTDPNMQFSSHGHQKHQSVPIVSAVPGENPEGAGEEGLAPEDPGRNS